MKNFKIAVVSLGKIGLPLAVQFAHSDHNVIGVDEDDLTVTLVNQGAEPYPGEELLQRKLTQVVDAGKLRATSSYAEAIPSADAIVITTPLLVNDQTDEPNFRQLDVITKRLAKHLTPHTLISYETTLPVGTTRDRLKPAIELVSGLKEGREFYLIHSAERLYLGRIFEDLRRYPKLVGAFQMRARMPHGSFMKPSCNLTIVLT